MTQIMKRLLVAILSLAMIACFVPQTGTQAYAKDGDPAMVVGAESVLKSTANTDDAQTVFYGTMGETPIAWRVISYEDSGNGFAKQTGAMTLLSSGTLVTGTPFNPAASYPNDYAGSNLQSTVNDLFSSLFSEMEKKAVKKR